MDLRPMYTETKVSGEGLGCSATSIASGNSITEFCLTNEKSKIRPCFRHSTSAVQNEVDWCVGIKVSPEEIDDTKVMRGKELGGIGTTEHLASDSVMV